VDFTDSKEAGAPRYPRVLIVLMNKVKADDPSNLLIRMQFGDWPKDRLAQIHATGDPAGHGEFCGRYYGLQTCDRACGGLFKRLRGEVSEMVALNAVDEQARAKQVGLLGRWGKVIRKHVGEGLIGSGVWEVIFRIRLSKPMEKFIEAFKPDLIYCQGYSLGFATLPLLISRQFTVPLCFQTTDDWPHNIYRHSPVGWLLRRRARQLITWASVRLAFGEKMRHTYQKRYGVPFEATYHLDDRRRFPVRTTMKDAPEVTLLYVGGLGHRRYEAIVDLNAAVTALAGRQGPIRIKVLCGGIPKEMPRALLSAPGVEFGPLPSHDELPGVLVGATVLFLPESFTESPAAIAYSLSTKAHLYMESGRPLLVYGPPYSGTVAYALSEGWGVVVTKRDPALLARELENVLSGAASVAECRGRAEDCLKRNHDLQTGRSRILGLLSAAVAHSDS
jgi:glycosyltransferase involved in cell wall biosynthesis